MIFPKSKRKYFCIGLNKTGTTSIAKAFKDLNFKVDDEGNAHKLLYAYEQRDFNSIVNHAKKAEVFQDAPWSYHYTFMHVANAFPKAKFILTIRDSADQWYESLVRFHSERFGKGGATPTVDDLKGAERPHGRSVYRNMKMRFGISDTDPYEKTRLVDYYLDHNRMVKNYFEPIPEKLLILNLSESDGYRRFCEFIGVESTQNDFPWLNKTASRS